MKRRDKANEAEQHTKRHGDKSEGQRGGGDGSKGLRIANTVNIEIANQILRKRGKNVHGFLCRLRLLNE